MSYKQSEKFKQNGRLADDASVAELMRPLLPFFEQPGVTEICVNQPGIVFVEAHSVWSKHELPDLTFDRCLSLAISIATYTNQDISNERPLLSATLPAGERVQLVIPPACPKDCVSITIRLPSYSIKTLDEYQQEGVFEKIHWLNQENSHRHHLQYAKLPENDRLMIDLLEQKRFREFFDAAIRLRKNIAIVGDTGSGKTTFMKTICQSIPVTDRVITIEDVRELFLPKHPNCVHLLYNKDEQGLARVSPANLIASTMRMKPDRVLLAELRGSEAFDFLKLLTTGHSGSITSYHAQSCSLALERFALMAKEHPEASMHDDRALHRLLFLTVDVIAHFHREETHRYISELYFDPIKKAKLVFEEER